MSTATIQYLGHSTALITSEAGKRILIDPWLDGNPSYPQGAGPIGEIDLIALTHGHSDHVGSVLKIAMETGATLCATYELATLLNSDGVPTAQLEFMNKGGTVRPSSCPGISVTLTHAFHSSSYVAKDGVTYYAGEPCGVVITLESGKTIYHAGDTALFGDMKLIGERYKPVVALLPIGDRFTMGPEEAAIAVRLVRPETVIPIHHSTFGLLTGTPAEFERAVGDGESKVVALSPGETFKF